MMSGVGYLPVALRAEMHSASGIPPPILDYQTHFFLLHFKVLEDEFSAKGARSLRIEEVDSSWRQYSLRRCLLAIHKEILYRFRSSEHPFSRKMKILNECLTYLIVL